MNNLRIDRLIKNKPVLVRVLFGFIWFLISIIILLAGWSFIGPQQSTVNYNTEDNGY